ncbi:acetyl-CoA carboxylase biotin carboxylase subunit [Thermoactinomyces mirandus]|uniref:biotin carboxylase n=1 Tax=Thermoactinomyces mirandus TaxID=2756294 RepID=A0A7W1XQH0_9BACL|nr:acetyl-CoA carboxylase biotin carboxylase subunit [Thermoactinomyces mirandus]MBA4601180.1 acetyl-CoA carboxylase biotin carboxylase subunit [Thermoactinomyces mirandus]
MQKVLIANRGEIACRIIRTCREKGLQTVAVYSEADQEMPFVKMADEAVCIGPPPVAKSYLNMEQILQAAKKTKADAVHPGYGFLSENSTFAGKVLQSGLLWIGPRPEVIARMGDKVAARQTMEKAGVPVVPGSVRIDRVEDALEQAAVLGYPVMVKAIAGGGGIGMHVCDDEQDLQRQFSSLRQRAKAYFGNDSLFMEKVITDARHVEVQIAADERGNVIHLFERECSIQRRNQKVIEESPSPSIHETTRKKLCEAAVRAARAVQYTGVGTVEFLVDKSEQFYFLEMNTRLQVEHPVTEEIAGVDLVDWQIALAEGNPLPLRQEEVICRGHAMEFRIYAEDPERFLPSPGKVTQCLFPDGEGIRVDSGIEEENTVSPFYDSMIAKLIVSGCDRKEVLERAEKALRSCRVSGIRTNLPLLVKVLETDAFKSGQYHTKLISEI